ncbi:MAG TPA: sugar ABC transporter permease [Gemmatimonadota bacterium]|nr:sugar ABC transporter permease [Gemmatimonadota bacterium]
MSRLRTAYLLLVVAPAVAFTGLGIGAIRWSRATLVPELDRNAAHRAAEYLRSHRAQLTDELQATTQLGTRLEELDIERYAVYDSDGRAVEHFPGDAPAVPLTIGTPQVEAMLAAARRGNATVDLVMIGGRVAWLAYLPADGRIVVATLRADPALATRFRDITGYSLTLYHGARLALASDSGFSDALPETFLDSLASFDRTMSLDRRARQVAAPFRDFDAWDVTGAVVLGATNEAPALPKIPVLPVVFLIFAATFTTFVTWRVTLSTSGPLNTSRLRRGFVIALVPPALAAAWLAAADARLSATATDATLELAARTLALVDDHAALTPTQLARFTGTDVVLTRGDSVLASDPGLAGAITAAPAEATGRLRLAGRRIAYRSSSVDGEPIVLLAAPLEDARKTALFWLAGLYGLLAVGVLIYASLAFAAGDALGLREAKTAWAFVSPSLALLLIFSAAPLLFAFYLSFHRWNLLEPAKPFVGLGHYIELARDGLFWNAAKNTAVYSLYVPLTMVCALAVAILLNRRIKGVALLRAIFFLPYITSFVAISIVWQWMYDPDFGLFNWLIGLVGLGPYPWLNSPATALLALIIMAVWIHIGFQMIIFLAGLQSIPNELYEAAMIDGAGPWRRFWRITLPLLRPTTFFVLVTSIIGSFQVFTFIYVMTEGGPLHATDVIVYHIYQNAWQFLRMGYASAMSWALFAVIFAITLLQFRFLGRRAATS